MLMMTAISVLLVSCVIGSKLDDGTHQLDDVGYLLSPCRMPYASAERYCSHRGGFLVNVILDPETVLKRIFRMLRFLKIDEPVWVEGPNAELDDHASVAIFECGINEVVLREMNRSTKLRVACGATLRDILAWKERTSTDPMDVSIPGVSRYSESLPLKKGFWQAKRIVFSSVKATVAREFPRISGKRDKTDTVIDDLFI